MKTLRVLAGVLVICLVATAVVIAAVPGTITYQGRLTDQPGTALNGNVDIVFSIYSAASGGTALWQETQTGVPVQKGLFTVELGAVTPFSPTLFTGADLYLGVKVGTDAEMTPRQKLNSVPFAVKASVADSLSSVGTSDQIISTVPTGTAPLQISSTTVVGNLNADLLDGQHASDIIAASADEVRTPISACGTISTSGSFYLTGNITATGTCLTVNADNVTIDLMGFTITGPGSGSGVNHGILMSARSNVEIRNGSITAFGTSGISEGSAGGKGHRVINMRVSDNGYQGIILSTPFNLIKDCTSFNNGSTGIYGGTGSTITGNIANNNGDGGIYGDTGSAITGNIANNNATVGIYGVTGSSITGNTVFNNAGVGIYASASCLIKDNTIYSNNTSNTLQWSGLTVVGTSRVVGNILSNNKQKNIFVTGNDNILRENHLTGSSGYGIYFSSNGNFYKENTASGNSLGNYYLGTTTQTDGGGNVGF